MTEAQHLYPLICALRGAGFTPKKDGAKWCSTVCRMRHHDTRVNPRVNDLLTVSEAAARKGVSESTMRRQIKQGRIHAIRRFGRTLIHKAQVI